MAFDIYHVRDVRSGQPTPSRTARPGWCAPQGTLSMQRRFTSSTGQAITRLPFVIYDITTLDRPNAYN